MATPESFKLDIQRWIDKAQGKTKEFATEFIQDVAGRIRRQS